MARSTHSQKTTAKRTQARGEAFAQAVLNITLLQLAELGFERLSIPAVAQLAQVNKTSIYRRWPTKADLVRDALSLALGPSADAAPDTGSFRGDLLALARTAAALMQSPVGKALMRITLSESAHPELQALALAAQAKASAHAPVVVLMRAVQRGEIRAGVDPALILFTLAGTILHKVFVEHAPVSETFLEQAVDVVLNGASSNL
jgi:AcrR family transcriptional regulator